MRLYFIAAGNSGDLVQFYSLAMTTYFADQTLNIVRAVAISFAFLFLPFIGVATSQIRSIRISFYLTLLSVHHHPQRYRLPILVS